MFLLCVVIDFEEIMILNIGMCTLIVLEVKTVRLWVWSARISNDTKMKTLERFRENSILFSYRYKIYVLRS